MEKVSKEILIKRTILVLEKTKKQIEKYKEERKQLDLYLRECQMQNNEEILSKWTKLLKSVENQVNKE